MSSSDDSRATEGDSVRENWVTPNENDDTFSRWHRTAILLPLKESNNQQDGPQIPVATQQIFRILDSIHHKKNQVLCGPSVRDWQTVLPRNTGTADRRRRMPDCLILLRTLGHMGPFIPDRWHCGENNRFGVSCLPSGH